MNEKYKYGIEHISKLTGVKPKTLKESWERFAELPTPYKDSIGRRWYSEEDIKIYTRITELKEQYSLPDIGQLLRKEFPDYFEKPEPESTALANQQPAALVIRTNEDLINTVQDIANVFTDRNQELLSDFKTDLSTELTRDLNQNLTSLTENIQETFSKNWEAFYNLNERFNQVQADNIVLEARNRDLASKLSDATFREKELAKELERIRAAHDEKMKKLQDLERSLAEYKNMPWYKRIFKSG